MATAKQNLIVSQTNLQLQQLLMKNAITRNNTDPILATAPVIPTDTLQINEPFEVPPVEQLIDSALKNRPEIIQSRLNLTNRQVGLKAIKNLQLPTVDLFAFYGGRAWRVTRTPTSPAAIRRRRPANAFRPERIPDTGYGHAFGNMFNSSAPDKGVGVNINIPLRNRQNQADQVRSVIEYRQAELSAQQQANTITLQVRNAQFALQQNYAALQAAVAARDYATQNLDAEQKKYSLGASTSTLVLAGIERSDAGRVQRAGGCHQLRKVTSAARPVHRRHPRQAGHRHGGCGVRQSDRRCPRCRVSFRPIRRRLRRCQRLRSSGAADPTATPAIGGAVILQFAHAVRNGRHAFLFLPERCARLAWTA